MPATIADVQVPAIVADSGHSRRSPSFGATDVPIQMPSTLTTSIGCHQLQQGSGHHLKPLSSTKDQTQVSTTFHFKFEGMLEHIVESRIKVTVEVHHLVIVEDYHLTTHNSLCLFIIPLYIYLSIALLVSIASVSNTLMSLVTTMNPFSLFLLKMKLLGKLHFVFRYERLQNYMFELNSVLVGPRLTLAVHATAFTEAITLHSPLL
jgi:hypothetical protein